MRLHSLLRSWFVTLIGCLPLLALLLVPELMRSRAGSEQLLLVGTLLLLLLLVAAFVFAPVLSAWAAPRPDAWTPRSALRSAREVWRLRTGSTVLTLLSGLVIYAAGQVLAYWVGSTVPYISENPAHVTNPSEPAWLIVYPAYALQALVIYVLTTMAVAWYGWRIRALALSLAPVPKYRSTPTSMENITAGS